MKISEIRTMVNEELSKVFEQSPEDVMPYISPKAGAHVMAGGKYLVTLPNNALGIVKLKALKTALSDVYTIKIRGRHENRKDLLGTKYRPGDQNEPPIAQSNFWAVYLYEKH